MKQAKCAPRPEYTGWYRNMYKTLDIAFDWMPNYLGITVATVVVFLAGSFMRGDWIFVLVHFIRRTDKNATINDSTGQEDPFNGWTLKAMRLDNISMFIIANLTVSYTMYFVIGGFLQWYFYIRQRDTSHEWKCQPDKFLTPELELHEVISGSINIALGGTAFAFLSCYVYNGGMTTIYFVPNEYGWLWFFLSIPIHFLYQDAGAYYVHRLLHTRFFYVHFHKWHHYYKQPTAFSTTAMHPVEFLILQSFMILPAFTIPLNAGIYIATLLYIYYYGIVSHSGIELEAFWPWQPKVSFHDNHHQYYHVNFGFNTEIFDRFHGTIRQKDCVYNEQIYGGKGIDLKKATAALQKEYAQELAAEIKPKSH